MPQPANRSNLSSTTWPCAVAVEGAQERGRIGGRLALFQHVAEAETLAVVPRHAEVHGADLESPAVAKALDRFLARAGRRRAVPGLVELLKGTVRKQNDLPAVPKACSKVSSPSARGRV